MNKVLSMLLVFVLSLAFGPGAEALSAIELPDSLDSAEMIEITFWAASDIHTNQNNIYTRAAREFEALFPNVKVNVRIFTDYDRIHQQAINSLADGITPNVMITHPDNIAFLLKTEGDARFVAEIRKPLLGQSHLFGLLRNLMHSKGGVGRKDHVIGPVQLFQFPHGQPMKIAVGKPVQIHIKGVYSAQNDFFQSLRLCGLFS